MNKVFSVTQINSYIHRLFESDYALKKISLKGEVSNCKYHSSGHIYFTLKDEKSSIRCIMFSSDRFRGLKFQMEDGQQVIVTGNISVYERTGAYQMYARTIDLSGAGELYLKYEKLKEELYEKGYFDFERKKTLPLYPKKIGIVTAATGAAIQAIRSVAKRRNPFVQLYLYPAKVQGEGASLEIARGIRYFDRQKIDIIIIGRGGGSIEDLWAFNEMPVAEAIYHAKTPIISGTGHEIDTTIADYCADVRAATPTAACELAIPDVYALMQQMDNYRELLDSSILTKIQRLKRRCSDYEKMIAKQSPKTKLLRGRMRTEDYRLRLSNLMDRKMLALGQSVKDRERRLHQDMNERIQKMRHAYELKVARLHALSPTARLGGGYAYVQQEDGRPITGIHDVSLEKSMDLIFQDGKAKVHADQVMIEIPFKGANSQLSPEKSEE